MFKSAILPRFSVFVAKLFLQGGLIRGMMSKGDDV